MPSSGESSRFEPRFDGPMAVLASRRTASASEGLAVLIRRTERVTIIGEATGGGLFSASWFGVGQG